jgi:hypothetical protein
VSNTRGRQAGLDDTKNYREQMGFRFKRKDYTYSPVLHLMTLSAYTQASVQNTDQQMVLVDKNLGKRKLTLTILELQTLLDKCDRALFKMERARTKVDEVAE